MRTRVGNISSQRPDTKFGAVMFSVSTVSRSVNQFMNPGAVGSFCAFVYGNGGASLNTTATFAALQAAAADLEGLPATDRKFVVLVTDDSIDGTGQTSVPDSSRIQLVQQLDALTSTNGGGVFISLWQPWHDGTYYPGYALHFTSDPSYPSLAVNGDFDHSNYPNTLPPGGRYLFDHLTNRILFGQ